jgi:hypothetical protein
MKNLANILLGVYLLAVGLVSLLNLHFTGSQTILAVVALAAGVLILLAGRGGVSAKLGMILLAIWLIAEGLIKLTGFSFKGIDIVMAILALAAGVLILLKR